MVFGNLLNRQKSRQIATPPGVRIYAVGDIHGRDDLLRSLLAEIERDASETSGCRKVLIFLGDYVDRGLGARQVIERLSTLALPEFEMVFLKGNHEVALMQFLEDAQFGRTWKYYGGLETLHSYGVDDLTLSDEPADFERARIKFNEALPLSHRQFLSRLVLTAEFGDYFFVHAGVRPGISLKRQAESDLLWIRDEFLESRASFGKVIVHGHTPKEEAVFRRNRIGIDTGAYITGVLTCLVLDGLSQRLIQTGHRSALMAASD